MKLGNEGAQAQNLLRWGEVCIEQNDYNQANQLLNESLAIYHRLEEDTGIADAQFMSTRMAIERSQYSEAEQLLQSCLSIYERLGDTEGIAAVNYYRAWISYSRNDIDSANQLLQHALHTYEAVQNKHRLIEILKGLAQVAAQREAYALAHGYCERAYQIAQELQDEVELASLYLTWTVVLRRQGKFEEAKMKAEHALPLFQHLGLRRLEGMTRYQLGAILTELREFDQAQSYLLESLKISESCKDMLQKLFTLTLLVDLYQVFELPEKSRCAWLEAQALAQELDHQDVLQQLQEKLGALSPD
ncbi:tetratricopeptide repeat protein [Chloroflexi bacterium TSY]|nr:tetratricopeptide repeat protein [Chloroflexi bacterium TSY]